MYLGFIFFLIIIAIMVLFIVTCYVCYRLAFYVPEKEKVRPEYELPPGEIYRPFHGVMLHWMRETKTFKQEKLQITAKDGYKLSGVYYEHFKNAPIEIMFHGYRGSAERDLCGGIQRCQKLKRNVIIVDQRGHGESDGQVISFGIKERYDVKSWADYAYQRFGDKVPLIITGISMGASTVLMASSLDLPKTVVGAVADCGYNDCKEIIKTVIKKMGLSPSFFYPLVRFSGKLFGGFDVEETSPEKEVKRAKIPIIFLHGKADDFVPSYMSEKNYKACASEKSLEIFECAGHGMSYLVDPNRYVTALKDFEKKHLPL